MNSTNTINMDLSQIENILKSFICNQKNEYNLYITLVIVIFLLLNSQNILLTVSGILVKYHYTINPEVTIYDMVFERAFS